MYVHTVLFQLLAKSKDHHTALIGCKIIFLRVRTVFVSASKKHFEISVAANAYYACDAVVGSRRSKGLVNDFGRTVPRLSILWVQCVL